MAGPQGAAVGAAVLWELLLTPHKAASQVDRAGRVMFDLLSETESKKKEKEKKKRNRGIPGWRSGLAPASGPGRDPGDPGSSPTWGSRCMEPASLSLSLSVCDYHKYIKIKKIKIN